MTWKKISEKTFYTI